MIFSGCEAHAVGNFMRNHAELVKHCKTVAIIIFMILDSFKFSSFDVYSAMKIRYAIYWNVYSRSLFYYVDTGGKIVNY